MLLVFLDEDNNSGRGVGRGPGNDQQFSNLCAEESLGMSVKNVDF